MSKAKEWRDLARAKALAEAVDLELPSGMVIRARRPNPLQLASWGRLPLSLASAAGGNPTELEAAMTNEDVIAATEWMRDLLEYCCLEPRISMEPGEDEIHPRDIHEADWTFILSWAMRGTEVRALEGFRRRRGTVGSGNDGEDVRLPAERDAHGGRSGTSTSDRPGGDEAAQPGDRGGASEG